MQFAAKEDIEGTVEQVFALLSDFDGLQRQAMRRGAEVERLDNLSLPGVGMEWDIGFRLRGKHRTASIRTTEYDPPTAMAFDIELGGLSGDCQIELVALSRQRTRMNIAADLKPHTLSARLMVQSLKLARGNLNKRFDKRVAEFAGNLEKRCRSA